MGCRLEGLTLTAMGPQPTAHPIGVTAIEQSDRLAETLVDTNAWVGVV